LTIHAEHAFRSEAAKGVPVRPQLRSLGHNRAGRGRWSPRRKVHLALSLFPSDEALNRRIPTSPQCQIDPL
jgi:hypothetical protein